MIVYFYFQDLQASEAATMVSSPGEGKKLPQYIAALSGKNNFYLYILLKIIQCVVIISKHFSITSP